MLTDGGRFLVRLECSPRSGLSGTWAAQIYAGADAARGMSISDADSASTHFERTPVK